MIKVTRHFINQVNSRIVNKNVLTPSQIEDILNKLDKIGQNIPSGKVYIRVKKFDYTIVCDDTSRGDTLVIVLNDDRQDTHNKCAITAVFVPVNTSGQYNINNCMSII